MIWAPTVPLGPDGAAVGALGGPYLDRTPIRDSRATRQALTGPVVPNRGSHGNPTEPDSADMAQGDPTSPDGCLDGPIWVYNYHSEA